MAEESIADRVRQTLASLPAHVLLVAAAKTRTPEEVRAAAEAGVAAVGHNYVQETETIRRALYRRIMRRLADKHATAIVAVSRAAMEHAWGARWQRDPRARVIYNGLDLTPFRDLSSDTAAIRLELGVPRDGLLAINVGRIDPPKAHDVLLEAAAQVIRQESRLHLLLVGDGSLRQEMQKKARDLNIYEHVHFLGIRDDVPRLLVASDCFVLASRREGLPGALLEAVAARLPAVATDLPGIREVAEHTTLITIVPVEDPPALASALRKPRRLRECSAIVNWARRPESGPLSVS